MKKRTIKEKKIETILNEIEIVRGMGPKTRYKIAEILRKLI